MNNCLNRLLVRLTECRILNGHFVNTKVIQKEGMKTVTIDDKKTKSEGLKVRKRDIETQRANC